MKVKNLARAACLATITAFGLATAPANAVTVTAYGTTALGSLNVSVVGRVITIDETWTNSQNVFLEFTGLDTGAYQVIKNITNNSGSAWTSIANELLDSGLDNNDPRPQPAFIPVGFSSSSDTDGLSFDQNNVGGYPRSSTGFPSINVDENTDARDFIDFFGATVNNGSSFSLTYGLIDTGGNQPFLLSQRVNVRSVPEIPEPATWLMLISGFGLVGATLRRQSRNAIEQLA